MYQSLKDAYIELKEERDVLSSDMILNRDGIIIDIYKVFERLTHDILCFYAEEFFDVNADYSRPA